MSHRKLRGAYGTRTSAWRLVVAIFALLPLSGCTVVSSDRWGWLWFVVPFAFFFASTFFIFERRRRQISSWDLRFSPEAPSRSGIIRFVIALAAVGFIGFAIYNLALDMDSSQKGLNIGLWFLGTAIGSTLALFVGFRLAEPKPLVDAPKEN